MSYREPPGTYSDIYAMEIRGSSVSKLTNFAGGHEVPSYWPGTRIAFSSLIPLTGAWRLMVMDGDGSNVQRLTSEDVSGSRPVLGPENQFGFRRPDGIWLGDIGQSQLRPLQGTLPGDGMLAWSPDGRAIIFERQNDLYIIRSDASAMAKLIEHGDSPTVAMPSPDSDAPVK